MRLLIAGATGAIGRPLIRCLRERGHAVFALARSPESARAVAASGAEPVIADALDAAAVKAALVQVRPEAVINELTSLPRHYTAAEMAAAAERDRKVRVEGNTNLLAALRGAGVHRYLLQSSGFWYAPGEGLADEGEPFRSSTRPRRRSPPARAAMPSWKGRRRPRALTSSPFATASSTAPAPGSTPTATSVTRSAGDRFQ